MSKGGKTTKDIGSERRAEMRAKVVKQVECEKDAHRIVERLLDNPVSSEYLIDCAVYITPRHYSDVVEERALVSQCGYPVCNGTLRNVPNQTYHISTKANNVYDITERKSFCRNHCYKASKFFERQLSSSPVWVREEDKPQRVTLLSEEEGKNNDRGCGEEMLHVARVQERDVEGIDEEEVTVGQVAEHLSSLMFEGDSRADGGSPDKIPRTETATDANSGHHDVETSEHGAPVHAKSNGTSLSKHTATRKDVASNSQEGEKDVTSKFESRVVDAVDEVRVQAKAVTIKGDQDCVKGKKAKKDRQRKKSKNKLTALDVVYSTLHDWKTVETVRFLFGDTAASEYEQVKPTEQQASLATAQGQTPNQGTADNFSQKLHQPNTSQPLTGGETTGADEEHLPETVVAEKPDSRKSAEGYQPSGPLPDWPRIEKEQELYELKVKEFFTPGVLRKEQAAQKSDKESREDDARPAILPPVDSKSQKGIRRKIVSDKVKQAFSGVLAPLGLMQRDVSVSLNDLLKTFNLQSTNITLRSPEWMIAAIALLYLLSKKHRHLRDALDKTTSATRLSVLLERAGTRLEDVHLLVEKLADQHKNA